MMLWIVAYLFVGAMLLAYFRSIEKRNYPDRTYPIITLIMVVVIWPLFVIGAIRLVRSHQSRKKTDE